MLELRLAGVHDDGENLVLEAADGSSYLLPIDQNLRQSIAKARRISPVRGSGSTGVFGPRDIQTRFRQGATVEEIAAESGWEAERVRRYEWPIIAERANIIQTARTVVISAAPGNKTPAQSLNQHIEAISERYGFTDAPADWSTWQQETGQWTLALTIDVPEEAHNELPRGVMFPARWNFNPANQSLYASNEAAYFLMGREHATGGPIPGLGSTPADAEKAPEEDSPLAASPAEAPDTAEPAQVETRLTRVRVPENREQNELLDELTARRGARSFDPASERKLADLLERARRGRPAGEAHPENPTHVPAPADMEEAPPADDVQELALQEPDAAQDHPSAEQNSAEAANTAGDPEEEQVAPADIAGEVAEESAPADTTVATDRPVQHQATEADAAASEASPVESISEADGTAEETADSEAPRTNTRGNRGKRTSVPSWDDIIFGNQRR